MGDLLPWLVELWQDARTSVGQLDATRIFVEGCHTEGQGTLASLLKVEAAHELVERLGLEVGSSLEIARLKEVLGLLVLFVDFNQYCGLFVDR